MSRAVDIGGNCHGFLNEEQREQLTRATQNAELLSLSCSPKSPTSLLLREHHIKVNCGNKVPAVGIGGGSKHVRKSHSGKLGRVKKGPGGGAFTDETSIEVTAEVLRNIESYKVKVLYNSRIEAMVKPAQKFTKQFLKTVQPGATILTSKII